MANEADRLTSQLYHLARIIGDLGKNVAEAQKELNADYLRNLKLLLDMIKQTVGATPAAAPPAAESGAADPNAPVVALLKALAPSRYEYTKTVLDFSADLAESKQMGIQAGASLSTQAVVVNAAMTLGYGHDYRASARINTTLEARPDPDLSEKLLSSAAEISKDKLELPEKTKLEQQIWDSTKHIYDALTS